MAKQVIVLDTNPSLGGAIQVRAAFWFPITVGKEWPIGSGGGSAYSGASAAEVQSIQTGQVVEEVRSVDYPTGTTPAQIKADLLTRYTARQTFLAAQPFKGQYYGVFYDGTVWSA